MFQLKDDILDFTSNSKELGKETHKDFQNGIYTFPVIMALKNPKLILALGVGAKGKK